MIFASTISNLVAGLRLLLPLPLGDVEFKGSIGAALALLALSVAIVGVENFSAEPGPVHFNVFAALVYMAVLALILLGGIVATHARGDLTKLPGLLVRVFSMLPWLALATFYFHGLLDRAGLSETAWLAFTLWAGTGVARAFTNRFPGMGFIQSAALALVVAFGLFGAWRHGYFQSLAYSYDEDLMATYERVDQEFVYYRQRELLDASVDAVTAGRRGVPEFFVIGFAANTDEHVFPAEARYAADTLAALFSAGARTLVLADGLASVDESPLANAYNLFRSVRGIAKKMQPDEDILVLFLTSHGNRDGTIEVSTRPFVSQPLAAQDLDAELVDAGVRWRIVVVSACFSGSFIEPLRSPESLIITASASDRSSFGCAADRELTYFGEAFLANALAGERDLVRAFDKAVALVTDKERRQGLPESRPQIFVGERIAAKLAQMNGE